MILNSIFLMAPGGGSNTSTLIMMAGVFGVMYFFMIRPQSKKAKEQKTFHAGIQKGDKIVTIGGMHGKIARVNDNTVELEIANNVVITIERSTISMEYTRALQNPNTTKPVAK